MEEKTYNVGDSVEFYNRKNYFKKESGTVTNVQNENNLFIKTETGEIENVLRFFTIEAVPDYKKPSYFI